MTEYICDFCNFGTKVKQACITHCNTNKHINNVRELKKCQCEFCHKLFCNKGALSRHVNTCPQKYKGIIEINSTSTDAKDIQIDFLKNQINSQKIEKEELTKRYELEKKGIIRRYEQEKNQYKIDMDNQINFLKTELNKLHSIIENGGTIVKASISALNYAIKNFNNAPELKSFTNFESLKIYETVSLIDTVVYMHKKKILHEYIGNIIILSHKKEKVNDQSIWNTDCARASYIIRNKINTIDIEYCEWQTDKNAKKIRSIIVEPILVYFLPFR